MLKPLHMDSGRVEAVDPVTPPSTAPSKLADAKEFCGNEGACAIRPGPILRFFITLGIRELTPCATS